MSLFGARRHPRTAPLPVEGRLPGFEGATGWLNSSPLTPEGLAERSFYRQARHPRNRNDADSGNRGHVDEVPSSRAPRLATPHVPAAGAGRDLLPRSGKQRPENSLAPETK
jgi:hypothetical protein